MIGFSVPSHFQLTKLKRNNMKKAIPYLLAIILAGFGLLTLFLSTSVIFYLFGIRAKEGNYVLFIVWCNFISSLLYLFAAYGFIACLLYTSRCV